MKTIVIIGGSSCIGEECVKLWLANHSYRVILVGRNIEKLTKIQIDLNIRYPSSIVDVLIVNFLKPWMIQKCVQNLAQLYSPDIVLIAQGFLTNQVECQQDLNKIQEMLNINGNSVVLFSECFANFFEKRGSGILAVIGSVAGDRGKKSNYIYGASKGLIERYIEGLQHRFAKTNVYICLIKPGPTNTPMTIELKRKGLQLASPKIVAKEIIKGIRKGSRVIYTPWYWRYIILFLKFLPFFIFNKLEI